MIFLFLSIFGCNDVSKSNNQNSISDIKVEFAKCMRDTKIKTDKDFERCGMILRMIKLEDSKYKNVSIEYPSIQNFDKIEALRIQTCKND